MEMESYKIADKNINTMVIPTTFLINLGTFTNGKREGQGKERYKSGAKYDGEFKSNMKEGKGKFIYPNSLYFSFIN